MSLFHEHPDLLETFFEGRRETFDEVYRIYRAPVGTYLSMLSTRVPLNASRAFAVADLRQEVFLRAFSPRARAAYDPTRRYAPYLMRIARNCFIDEARLRRREALLLEEGVPSSRFGEGASDPREAWDPHIEATVQSYLAGLPPRLRAVYEQRYVYGESQEIACVALGLSRRKLRTAEEHLKHGLRKELAYRELAASRQSRCRLGS
jgi:RNA polymerase sigma-70 factor (ECF subfamily)